LETMHVGSYETIPGWLVSGFTITNVTQGILGFWNTYNLLMRGKYYKAAMQTTVAHLGFWFLLVNGWDKTGYKRFFSKNRKAFDNWKPTNAVAWLGSDVARILLAYGVVFLPLMLYWCTKWLQEGYDMDESLDRPEDRYERYLEQLTLNMDLLFTVFGITLESAVVAHLCIRWFGWVFGGTAAAAAIYLGTISKWGIGPWLMKRVLKVDDLEGPPVWELGPGFEVSAEELVSLDTRRRA